MSMSEWASVGEMFEPSSDDAPPAPKWTERDLLDRLYRRHGKVTGNGPEWAYMEHVRDAAGHYISATIDALALHMWDSRKHEAHAYEVKVSRADFRRELADDCAKSAPWRAWVDYFWIVAPADVVPRDELPEQWGLLVPHGAGLKAAKQAVRLRPAPRWDTPPPDLPRGIVAAMLRAQVRNASRANGYWTRLDPTETALSSLTSDGGPS